METIKLFFKGFIEGFKRFGYTVSGVVNFVLLFFVYFIGVGLTSIIAKIFGKHFLDLKREKGSYWIKHEQSEEKMEDYKRMF